MLEHVASCAVCTEAWRLASHLEEGGQRQGIARTVERIFAAAQAAYARSLAVVLRRPITIVVAFLAILGGAVWMLRALPSEYAPKEDRGAFYILVNGPEGASFEYMTEYMDEIERRLMPLVENGEVIRLLIRAPRGFGNIENFNSGIGIILLED